MAVTHHRYTAASSCYRQAVEPIAIPRVPPPLEHGATIAVIAPSGPPRPARLNQGIAALEAHGFTIVEMPNLRSHHPLLPYLAGLDKDRASDFVTAMTDPNIDAVWCARGGTGTQRLLDALTEPQLAALRGAQPKWFLGFSDVTSLNMFLADDCNIAGVHSPGVTIFGEIDDEAQHELLDTLFKPGETRVLSDTMRLLAGPSTPVTGPMVGGCIRIISTRVGVNAPAIPPKAVLFLEDVGEAPYRIDRVLTHLLRGGVFDNVAATVIGHVSRSGDDSLVETVIGERLADLGIPIWKGVEIGHELPNKAFIFGQPVYIGDHKLIVNPKSSE